MQRPKIDLKDLVLLADNGDAEAKNIIASIIRYENNLEEKLNNTIRGYIREITTLLAKPNAVTDRDCIIPNDIIEIAEDWKHAINPIEDDIVEVE